MTHRLFIAVQTLVIGALAWSVVTGTGPLLVPESIDTPVLRRGLVLAGYVLFVVAGLIALAGFAALGRFIRIGPAPRPGARLVTHGIYRWLRHPMYTSVTLLSVAMALCRPTLWVVASAATVIVFYLVKARYEERLLGAAYGEEYGEYRRRTRGVLPPF